jgi:anti-sigma factor RsiW
VNLRRRFNRGSSQLSCRQLGRVLQSYLDDELDDDAARKVAAHLHDCRRCGLESATYEALRISLRTGPAGLADEPVARLREFGGRLANGEFDADELHLP